MFIPSIDAIWCECLTFFYKIGFFSFSTRSIVRGLNFERNEFHVFNRVIRQVEMCRYCCCSVRVTRVICGLSVLGESKERKKEGYPLSPLKAHRRANNLRDLLVRSDLPPVHPTHQPGTFPCRRTICHTCPHINQSTSILTPGGLIKITG